MSKVIVEVMSFR